ncbi:MAG: DUF1564 domain-containing protein [Leptospira sp.]|nr:DUF1564 domain-containing protein [Leptospira sp.]
MNPDIKIVKTTFLIDNKFNYSIDYSSERASSSCFEITAELYDSLLGRIGTEARIDGYLHYILNKYRILCYSGKIEKFEGVKLKYQDQNQDFKRADFRPFAGDWAELRILASMHGMTMTRFFVMLLGFDMGKLGEDMAAVMRGVDPTELLRHPIAYTQTLRRNQSKLTKFVRFGTNMYEFFEIESLWQRTRIPSSYFN